ncbi:MAG: hypothetical protein MJ215_05875 [Spirochaetia bacterium]|nr:hypothetical protein [Spirochaetia bacterium]
MRELKTLGIRTPENDKFLRFFSMVQDAAKEKKSVFFLDSGEGNEITDDDINAEDLTGWLIPSDKADSFSQIYTSFKELDKFDDFYVFVSWKKKDSKFIINFS